MISTLLDFTAVNSIHPSVLVAIGTISTLFAYLIFKSFFSSTSFKRDVHKKTFNALSDASSLLSNPDSVLSREKVNESIANYEILFAGARKNVGKTSTSDSIEYRAKEYKTMVDSFYDLVTDFYEFGWGQVRVPSIDLSTLIASTSSNTRVLIFLYG